MPRLEELFSAIRWMMCFGIVITACPAAKARQGQPAGDSSRIRLVTPNDQFPPLIEENPSDVKDAQAASAFEVAGPVVTTASALLVVLSLFAGLVWVSRRFGGGSRPSGGLPDDLFRPLGTAAVDAKTRVTFLQVADRILVIGQTTTGDPQTLAEFTDPDECRRIVNRCEGRPEIIGQRSSTESGNLGQAVSSSSTAPRPSLARRPLVGR